MQVKLISLRMINFMPFEDVTIDLTRNLTSILGRNGSGKSSIRKALGISLQLKDTNTSSVTDYIRKSPNEVIKKATTILRLDLNGTEMEITSTFSDGGRKITRHISYGEIEADNTEANKLLKKYFPEENLELAFSMQGDAMLLDPKYESANLKRINDIFGIDFTREVELIKQDTRNLKSQIEEVTSQHYRNEGKEATLKENYERLVESMNKLQEELADIEEEELPDLENLKSQEADLKTKYEKADKEYKEWAARRNVYTSYLNVKAKLQHTLKDSEADIAKLKPVEIPEELTNLKPIAELKTKLDELREQASNHKQSAASLSTEYKTEHNRIMLLKGGFCPTCKQKYSNDLMDADENNLKAIQDKIDAENKLVEEITVTGKALRLEVDEEEKKKEALSKLEKETLTYKTQYDIYSKRILDTQKELDNLIEPEFVDEEYDGVDSRECLKELQKVQQKIKDVEMHNSRLAYKKEAYVNALDEITITEETLRKLGLEVKETKTKLADLEQKKAQLDKIHKVFMEAPKIVCADLCKEIEPIMSSKLQAFDYPGVNLSVQDTDLHIELQKNVNGGVTSLDYRMISAFEKTMVNLALLDAISKYEGFELPFIFIDELDYAADPINTLTLGDLVISMCEGRQVLAITHDTALTNSWVSKFNSLSIFDLSGGLKDETEAE